ncbi:MAG: response regulator, partial [Azoarcus sp.]|nr:response regulator [Azoarcus sp.]
MSESHAAPDQQIYIVDDDDALRDSLVWMLESSGYAVSAFESAECFLSAYGEQMSGCLVLDVRMPGMSGLELFE